MGYSFDIQPLENALVVLSWGTLFHVTLTQAELRRLSRKLQEEMQRHPMQCFQTPTADRYIYLSCNDTVVLRLAREDAIDLSGMLQARSSNLLRDPSTEANGKTA